MNTDGVVFSSFRQRISRRSIVSGICVLGYGRFADTYNCIKTAFHDTDILADVGEDVGVVECGLYAIVCVGETSDIVGVTSVAETSCRRNVRTPVYSLTRLLYLGSLRGRSHHSSRFRHFATPSLPAQYTFLTWFLYIYRYSVNSSTYIKQRNS